MEGGKAEMRCLVLVVDERCWNDFCVILISQINVCETTVLNENSEVTLQQTNERKFENEK